MKVYVDRLPKCCEECPCCNNCMDYGCSCSLDDIKLTYDDYANKRHKTCPLQSLTEYTKQVRKQVCEEIRNMSTHYEHHINEEGYDKIDVEQFIINKEILDQIQGE